MMQQYNSNEFVPFEKIPRLKRTITITEKIDGTNAQIFIDPTDYDGNPPGSLGFVQTDTWGPLHIFAGSRNRYVTPENDNYGFARWVQEHMEDLAKLGPGRHYGEWWGQGIQRRYGLEEKRFSLFNVHRWKDVQLPQGVYTVPIIYHGDWMGNGSWSTNPEAVYMPDDALNYLRWNGSVAVPGFMDPEGIVVFHSASNTLSKATIKDDEKPKGVMNA